MGHLKWQGLERVATPQPAHFPDETTEVGGRFKVTQPVRRQLGLKPGQGTLVWYFVSSSKMSQEGERGRDGDTEWTHQPCTLSTGPCGAQRAPHKRPSPARRQDRERSTGESDTTQLSL